MTIELHASLLEQIVEKSQQLLNLAELHFERPMPEIEIRFDLRGQAAGMVKILKKGGVLVRFNPILLTENRDSFLSQTLPHEIAHVVAYALYRKVRPHGPEWQLIMSFFGAESRRCHNYDVRRSTTRRFQRFSYRCDCQEHQLTTIRHNRIAKGQSYICRNCKESLRPVKQIDSRHPS